MEQKNLWLRVFALFLLSILWIVSVKMAIYQGSINGKVDMCRTFDGKEAYMNLTTKEIVCLNKIVPEQFDSEGHMEQMRLLLSNLSLNISNGS